MAGRKRKEMSTKISADVFVSVDTLEDGGFRVAHKGLGLFAYGESQEDAAERFKTAYKVLGETIWRNVGIDALKERLDRAGVKYHEDTESRPPSASVRRGETTTLELVNV
jgi:hypothetical protein